MIEFSRKYDLNAHNDSFGEKQYLYKPANARSERGSSVKKPKKLAKSKSKKKMKRSKSKCTIYEKQMIWLKQKRDRDDQLRKELHSARHSSCHGFMSTARNARSVDGFSQIDNRSARRSRSSRKSS